MCIYSNSRADKILEEIRMKREIMIQCASKNGFTNEMTIKLSQELDELINEYQKTFRNTKGFENEVRRNFKQMVMILPSKPLVRI